MDILTSLSLEIPISGRNAGGLIWVDNRLLAFAYIGYN